MINLIQPHPSHVPTVGDYSHMEGGSMMVWWCGGDALMMMMMMMMALIPPLRRPRQPPDQPSEKVSSCRRLRTKDGEKALDNRSFRVGTKL